ncbi:hypothetical protein TNCV_4175151 [Trichonephila clavipes]|nr:hypothetical protein TNCV_4175151 [Trichonephila clavipes]
MKLSELGKSKESIALQCILSHCNISGNEQADRIFKVGSLQLDSHLPLRNIKRIIYSKLHGIKDSVCCLLCHQDEMDGDNLKPLPYCFKLFLDNSTEENLKKFYTSSSFYWASHQLMVEMLKIGVG